MIPLSEALLYFEVLYKQQEAIYADACDFGVWITEIQRSDARDQMMGLMDCYGYKMTRWEGNSNGLDGGNKTSIFIPFERADFGFNQYDGIIIVATFNRANTYDFCIINKEAASDAVGFLSININRKTMTLAEATEQYGYKD